MGFNWASYYGLGRVSETGPEVKGWIATDTNWQTASLLFKRNEQHHHNASTPMRYPGYSSINPATPATPLLTQSPTGGFIAAGTTVGVRMSYVDQYGLETEASPEVTVQMPPVVSRPNAPVALSVTATPIPGALPGATYVYALTKRLNTGESQISDVTTVDVPFDQTGLSSYYVSLQFDPIGSYTDSTDSILIYRTTGFDSNFVLLTTIFATPLDGTPPGTTNAFVDDGSVQDQTHQPPQASEFGKQNSLNIDWSNIAIESTAYYFKIYLTQQTGVWGINHIYQNYLLVNPSTPFPTNITYLGNEVLSQGYPLEFTQIPYGATKINLGSEAIGAPIYTQAADAQGYPTWNFVFPDQTRATPIMGNAYLDSSSNQLKIMLSSAGYTTFTNVDPSALNLWINDPSNESGLNVWASGFANVALKGTAPTSLVQGYIVGGGTGFFPSAPYSGSNVTKVVGGGPQSTNATNVAGHGQLQVPYITPGLQQTFPVTEGQPYTFSAYVACATPASSPAQYPQYTSVQVGATPARILLRWYVPTDVGGLNTVDVTWGVARYESWVGAGGIIGGPGSGGPPVSVDWALISVTATPAPGATLVQPYISWAGLTKDEVHYVDACMMTASNGVLPYFDGSTNGSTWLGAPYFSASQLGGGLYIHPTVEFGGHTASHIQAAPNVGGPTQDQLNNIFSTPVAGGPGRFRTQVTSIYKVTATPADLQNSTAGTWLHMSDMDTSSQWPNGISPDFTGQQMSINFETNAGFAANALNAVPDSMSFALEINGTQISETIRTFTGYNAPWYTDVALSYTTPITRPNNRFRIQWTTGLGSKVISVGGNIVGQTPRRSFVLKELF